MAGRGISGVEILGGHHVAHEVLELIRNSSEYLVLATAYLKSWLHLNVEIKAARERGVQVHMVIRSGDGPKTEQEKRKRAMNELRELVEFHEVDRLHAKVYISESQAIISSMNLVASSRDSVEVGVRFTDPQLIGEAFDELARHCPGVRDVRTKGGAIRRKSRPVADRQSSSKDAYCIGCGDGKTFEPAKPLCAKCYKSSRRGSDLEQLESRCCHRCGSGHAATLSRPICYKCFKQLPVDTQEELKELLN